jgi:5'(3')-deoxyribonucleotidase
MKHVQHNESKPVIAVDIDEVLSPLHDLVFAHHNEVYGTNFPLHDTGGSYFIDKYTGEPYEVTMEKLKKFIDTEAFQNLEPLDGAVEAIKKVASKYDIIVITSRQDFYFEITHKWLEQHFPQTFKSVHFTEYGAADVKISKSDLCLKLGARYLIDDNLEFTLQAAAAGIKVLLFGDYPWNQANELPGGVIRVKDWNEVLQELM